MGDWNASNILQNQGRANFTQMQQPTAAPKPHDPFANLTSMGQSLPPQQPQRQQHQQQQQQQAGVTAHGAWGAQFQTRQAAPAANGGGGWNASAYMQTNTAQYKQQQQRAQAPPQQQQQKKSSAGAFDNLLDGFGGASSFGQKQAQKNMKMGDLKV